MVANDVVYSTSRLARELISIYYITKRTARTARALAHSIVRSGMLWPDRIIPVYFTTLLCTSTCLCL